MIIVLTILGLIVAIFVLSVRYFKSYARLKSHSNFESEAKQTFGKIKYNDPKITCDFCGAQINTQLDKVCPQCGGAYENDKEWRERYNFINAGEVNSDADYAAEAEINRVKAETALTAKRLRIAIFILLGILGFYILLGSILLLINNGYNYIKSNKLNRASYDNYMEVPYDIAEDNVIVDSNGIKMSLAGVYREEGYSGYSYRAAYHIENTSGQDRFIRVYTCAINYASADSMVDGWVKKGADIVVYENLASGNDQSSIFRIAYYDCSIEDNSGTLYERSEPIEIWTTASEVEKPKLPTEGIIFENEYMIVTSEADSYDDSQGKLPERYKVHLYNKSDKLFTACCRDGKLNDTLQGVSGTYKNPVYDNCLSTFTVYAYSEEYKNRLRTDDFMINIEFSCIDDPSLDFSTGYIKVN